MVFVPFPSLNLFLILVLCLISSVRPLPSKEVISAFHLLYHTAPAQAASLLILGPFVDFWLTNNRVVTYNYNNMVLVSVVQPEK
jgi:hypothetical protein